MEHVEVTASGPHTAASKVAAASTAAHVFPCRLKTPDEGLGHHPHALGQSTTRPVFRRVAVASPSRRLFLPKVPIPVPSQWRSFLFTVGTSSCVVNLEHTIMDLHPRGGNNLARCNKTPVPCGCGLLRTSRRAALEADGLQGGGLRLCSAQDHLKFRPRPMVGTAGWWKRERERSTRMYQDLGIRPTAPESRGRWRCAFDRWGYSGNPLSGLVRRARYNA